MTAPAAAQATTTPAALRSGGTEALMEPLLRLLEARDSVQPDEWAALAAAAGDVRGHSAGEVLVGANVPADTSRLLLGGIIGRVRHMAEGKRQIVAMHLPGDFVDLHSLLLKRLDHDVVALTDVRVLLFPHAALRRVTETQPHLTRMLWLLTAIDAAMHREWISRQGRAAAERVAALLCEAFCRLQVVGGTDADGFPFALTQLDIGDMTGLTAVHVNRTLRRLREAGLAGMRGRRVTIPDVAALRAFADFDPGYLYLNREPR